MSTRTPRHWIGTSGWTYDNWTGPFYPAGVSGTARLGHYAKRFPTVEINASFYRLPRETMLKGWAARTPAGFVFAVKAWRQITHRRRLDDCAEPLGALLDRAALLGDKCEPILFQCPPKWHADTDRLRDFLALLPKDRRFAFEFRDPDWHADAVYDLLATHDAAFVPFELGPLAGPRVATADFVYVRLHGRERRYRGAYDDAALADWANWLAGQMGGGRDAYVYFDNTDERDDAPRNAQRLDALLHERIGRAG